MFIKPLAFCNPVLSKIQAMPNNYNWQTTKVDKVRTFVVTVINAQREREQSVKETGASKKKKVPPLRDDRETRAIPAKPVPSYKRLQ